MLFYMIALLIVAIDQTSKFLIRSYLKIDQMESFIGIKITHYENSGLAHGLLQGYGRYFAVVAVLFAAGVLYYRKKGIIRGAALDISMGFLVGGALGNAIDRIFYGQVTDFIMLGKGILNLADYAINIGIFIILIKSILSYFKSKRR